MAACGAMLAAVLAALALFAAPAAAQVPDPFARELAQKLARAESALAERAYVHGAGPFSGGMGAGETRRIPLTLRAGQDYRVVGVCDGNCAAPRLALFDANGARLAQAPAGAGASEMLVRVPFTGGYEVEVDLPRCAAERCWYAVNVYGR